MSTDAHTYGYDAAADSSNRSMLLFPVNSRLEINTWTRRRLLEKNRALEANFGFIGRMQQKFGRHVAGKGIFPFPTTSDLLWNKAAKAAFERWASNAATYSVDGSLDFWEDQRFCAEQLGCGDGEIFRILTKIDGNPAIQAIDPFEVGARWNGMVPGIYDGVQTDAYLRPVNYEISELPDPARAWALNFSSRLVDAGSVLHLFRRRRAKQLRGLPPLYSGINASNDVMDKLSLETAAEKLHSLLAVAKTSSEANKGRGVGAGLRKQVKDTEGNVIGIEEKIPRGAVTVELNKDEKLELLTSSRPSPEFIEGIKLYCLLISIGADLPVSVVLGFAGVGGTATRAELEDAQNTFDMLQDFIVWRHSQRIYTWRTAIAMQTGELPACKDPHWWACDWHGPAKITVDYGRSAAANIDLVKSGMLSVPRYAEERGMDAYIEGRKQIDWLKEMKAYCDANGVDFNTFMEATPGSVVKINNSGDSNA